MRALDATWLEPEAAAAKPPTCTEEGLRDLATRSATHRVGKQGMAWHCAQLGRSCTLPARPVSNGVHSGEIPGTSELCSHHHRHSCRVCLAALPGPAGSAEHSVWVSPCKGTPLPQKEVGDNFWDSERLTLFPRVQNWALLNIFL